MQKFKTILALTLGVLQIPGVTAPAQAAADPTFSTLPTFTITGNNLSLDTNGSWVNGTTYLISGSPIQQAFACGTSLTASVSTRFVSNQIMEMTGCEGLFQDSAGTIAFSSGDLSTAYIGSSSSTSAYSSAASFKKHIVMVTYVNAVFFANTSTTQIYYGFSASTEYNYVPQAPAVSGTLALVLNGSTVSVTDVTWNPGGAGDGTLYSCTSEIQAQTTPTTNPPSSPTCSPLQNQGGPGIPTDLSNALRMGMPYTSSQGPYIVYASSVYSSPSNYYVWTASRLYDPNSSSSSSQDSSSADVARPYNGPILQSPSFATTIPAGGKVTIPGSNLGGITSVEIAGVAVKVVVNSDGEVELTLPTGLAAGVYDLVVYSSYGRLTVQDAIKVGPPISTPTGKASPSVKRVNDGSIKVWVFDVVGAGKVQLFANGKEVAWVNASSEADPRLRGGYLVRTVSLDAGKNVLEIYVDGKRVKRVAYTG